MLRFNIATNLSLLSNGALLCMRQFLATGSSLKMTKHAFYST